MGLGSRFSRSSERRLSRQVVKGFCCRFFVCFHFHKLVGCEFVPRFRSIRCLLTSASWNTSQSIRPSGMTGVLGRVVEYFMSIHFKELQFTTNPELYKLYIRVQMLPKTSKKLCRQSKNLKTLKSRKCLEGEKHVISSGTFCWHISNLTLDLT